MPLKCLDSTGREMGRRLSYRSQDAVESRSRSPTFGPLHFGGRTRGLHQLHVMRIIRQLMFFMLAAAPVLSDFSSADASTSTMKAVVIHEYGGTEVLKFEDVPRPAPKPDQI